MLPRRGWKPIKAANLLSLSVLGSNRVERGGMACMGDTWVTATFRSDVTLFTAAAVVGLKGQGPGKGGRAQASRPGREGHDEVTNRRWGTMQANVVFQ
jgi:hypothetical protein